MSNSNVQTIHSKDVTKSLEFYVSMTGVFDVDDESYVTNTSGERVLIQDKNRVEHPVQLYKDVLTDKTAIIVNPYHETIGANADQAWFYTQTYVCFSQILNQIVTRLLEMGAEQKAYVPTKGNKKSANDNDHGAPSIPLFVTNALAPVIDDIDAKSVDEYATVIAKVGPRELVTMYYSAAFIKSVVESNLIAGTCEDIQKIGIRKKTIEVIRRLYMAVLGVNSKEELENYAVKASKGIGCPRFETHMCVLFGLYRQLNEFIPLLGDRRPVNLDTFSKHIENIPHYHKLAKWQKSAVLSAQVAQDQNAGTAAAPVATTTPTGVPAPWATGIPGQVNPAARSASGVPLPAGMMPQQQQQTPFIIGPNGQMIPVGAVAPGMMPQMPMQGMIYPQQMMQPQMPYPQQQFVYPQQQMMYPQQQQQPMVHRAVIDGVLQTVPGPQVPMYGYNPSMMGGVVGQGMATPGAPWTTPAGSLGMNVASAR